LSVINLKDLFRLIKRNVAFILSITIVCIGVGYCLSHYMMKKTFAATTSIVVTTRTTTSVTSEQDAYQEILRSNRFLSQAKKDLKLSTSVDKLINDVSIHGNEADVDKSTSHTYWLTVGGNNASQCRKTAVYLSTRLQKQLKTLKNVESVKSYGHNQTSLIQTAPHYKKITLTWGIVGLLISLLIVVFAWLYDRSFKRSSDIVEALDLPVLGIIPTEDSAAAVDAGRKDGQK
jgi:capsular polysaccharide biosynthesis protein